MKYFYAIILMWIALIAFFIIHPHMRIFQTNAAQIKLQDQCTPQHDQLIGQQVLTGLTQFLIKNKTFNIKTNGEVYYYALTKQEKAK